MHSVLQVSVSKGGYIRKKQDIFSLHYIAPGVGLSPLNPSLRLFFTSQLRQARLERMRKKSQTLKHLSKPIERTELNARVPTSDMEIIREKARRHTKGNVSEWVRYASTRFEPSAEELAASEV